jgi:hypothetical protein
MMKLIPTALATLVLAGPSFAAAHAVDEATVAAIEAKLAEMKCQMDPADIEMEDGGYELDDVICEGGQQMDIELDADLNEVDRRLE